jgi:putative transposase
VLKFKAHKEFGNPQQIVIGKKNNTWFVSFCYEVENNVKSEQKLLDEYSCLDETSLNDLTMGIDRGIVIPFQTSSHLSYDFDEKLKIKSNSNKES